MLQDEPDQKKPRQTGSMVAAGHHDDIVTRMKNIEMIEIGRHRIKPWYFSPYPQVRIGKTLHSHTSEVVDVSYGKVVICETERFICLKSRYINSAYLACLL